MEANTLTRGVIMPSIKKFNGTAEEYVNFKAVIEMSFWANPVDFIIVRNKIIFIGCNLEGPALLWFRDIIAEESTYLETYATFVENYKNCLSDPSYTIKYANALRKCYQGRRSVISYATEFKEYARGANFNDTFIMDQFRRGLNGRINHYLVLTAASENLESLIQSASSIESNLLAASVYTQSYDNKYPQKQSQNHGY
ncbi:Retrotransposon-like protein 1 [Zancudomyces culisetae]|uniref:Retrotransposon-like protein 1 n=1 Tax=Zancudomyces culisetae TaxID=1213189 RepID=A0A1R1PLN6_ZANCU|nr:Retrotransposon-like protein 1 [Zancudomyces culisetae]|eukprot:OMH81888.1 Retrotransposon-like protein 1 [Zancudomyces culisetae]